jgi:hypothetical protein
MRLLILASDREQFFDFQDCSCFAGGEPLFLAAGGF